jgi:hypothetical protein
MKRSCALAAGALLAAGCVLKPLPDGSRIARLSGGQMAQAAPPVSAEERERLKQLDAEVQAQQQQAAWQQAWLQQIERSRLQWELDYGIGRPAAPWMWNGPYGRRWDGWGAGFWGPWPY